MNKFIESCISIENIPIESEPIIDTVFDCIDNENLNAFTSARKYIAASPRLSDDQRKHFSQCLDYLCHSDYPLHKFHSIHIIDNNVNQAEHFVRIGNHKPTNPYPNRQDLYVTYNPQLFKSRFRQYLALLPFCKSSNNIKNDDVNMSLFFKILTVINCFSYVLLYDVSHKNRLKEYVNHPFRKSWDVVSEGVMYSWLGNYISNIKPYYSNVIFNSILLYINFVLVSQNKNKLKQLEFLTN